MEQYKHMGSMSTPCGSMVPDLSWRVDRTRVAYLAVAGRFFAAANFSLKCKRSVAATLLETRLLYSSETWPPLPMGHAKRLESMLMRWIRKVKRYRGESCNKTDAQIRAEFSIATMESKFRHRRLGFLAQLRTASPMLRALLQEGGMRLPWTKAVVGDLVALQAAQPKVAMMPHPAGDVDAWIKLAVDNKSSWKQLVRPVLTHIGSPALGPEEMVQCPDCHKSFLVKGLRAHRARVDNVFRVARTVVGGSGIYPVCGLFFHTRQRVTHHIEHSCESCKAAVQAGLVQTLPEAQMKELDAEDAKESREVAERLRIWYLPELDLLWVQFWYFWCCSASVLRGTCGSLVLKDDSHILTVAMQISHFQLPWVASLCSMVQERAVLCR